MICNSEETKLSQHLVPMEIVEYPPSYASAKGPRTGTPNSLGFKNMSSAAPFFNIRVLDLPVSFDSVKPHHRKGIDLSNIMCVVTRPAVAGIFCRFRDMIL